MLQLYTTHCPACEIIRTILDNNNIDYEIIDDEDKVFETAQKYNMTHMPFAVVDDKVLSSSEIKDYIQTKI